MNQKDLIKFPWVILVCLITPETPQEVLDKIKAFRESSLKLTPSSMSKEINKMDGKSLSKDNSKNHPALKFMYWQKFCWDTNDLPMGFLMSQMMEKNSKFNFSLIELRSAQKSLIT